MVGAKPPYCGGLDKGVSKKPCLQIKCQLRKHCEENSYVFIIICGNLQQLCIII